MKKIFLIWAAIALLLVGGFIVFYFFYQNSNTLTIQKCSDANFGLSLSSLDPTQEKTCANLLLDKADRIELKGSMIDDTPLPTIQALARGDFNEGGTFSSSPLTTALKTCIDTTMDNAAEAGCFYDTERSLQNKIRSLAYQQIQQEKEQSYIAHDSAPEFFADTLNDYWRAWYTSTTNSNSTKAKECNIEGTKSFAQSGWFETMSKCYIQADANEILWLLKQKEDRKIFFEQNWQVLMENIK